MNINYETNRSNKSRDGSNNKTPIMTKRKDAGYI